MKYFSRQEIERSIRELEKVHPFFLITFLTAKRANLPVGRTKIVHFDRLTDEFLQRYFRLHPKSQYYFKPFRGSDKSRVWVNPDYASSGLQTVNTQTFKDALLHRSKSREWGWARDYVMLLRRHSAFRRKTPLWVVAVWIYRDAPFDDQIQPADIMSRFLKEFRITKQERLELFDASVPSNQSGLFQDVPVEWNEIISSYPLPKDVGPDKGAVLTYLETSGVGPVNKLVLRPGSRLNLITGDNSLGKSFLLDVIWWALVGAWIGEPAIPYTRDGSKMRSASITFQLAATIKSQPQKTSFSFETYAWSSRPKQQVLPGLLVYARADGSYAIWDPLRLERAEERGALLLSREDVWLGTQGRIEGVIRDWASWQNSKESPFELFLNVLARISPPEFGKLEPGKPMRLPFFPQAVPTIHHSYGDVAILHESAAVRRMISLAYLIVWAWHQHRFNANFLSRSPERQIVVLIDELEAHLHPKWQRVILPALLGVFNDLSTELNSQLFVASHSPLVLASAEPVFRQEIDKLHALETTVSGRVTFDELPFIARGRVDEWLRSRAFGLQEPRSRPAADAIARAKELQESENISADEVKQVHKALTESIPPGDVFWARWILFAKRHGVQI